MKNPLIVRRFIYLGLAAFAGVVLARFGVNALLYLIGIPTEYSIQLALLLLSLPVLCLLWQFRASDTQAQITKATEGVAAARDATSVSSLERCMDALSSARLMTRRHGLIQLVKIKRKGVFAEEIDDATRQHINLENVGLNVDFSEANLWETGLARADLRGADLSSAENLENAKFADAAYDKTTKFPNDFDPEKARMRFLT